MLVKGFVHAAEEIGSLLTDLAVPDNYRILSRREILVDEGNRFSD